MKIECNDVMTLIRGSLMENFYREKDRIIKEHLIKILGEDFRLELPKHKLSVNIYPDGSELYMIDGEGIVKFLSLKSGVDMQNGKGNLSLTQNYYSFV